MDIPAPSPPNDIELRNIIDKLADFVARNGPEFESMTKSKQRGNPKFAFLYGGEFYNYYQYKVITKQAMMKQQQQQPQQNMSLPSLLGQHGIPPLLAGFGQQPPPQAQLPSNVAMQQHQQQQQQLHHQQQSQAQLSGQLPPASSNPNGNGSSNTMHQIWSNPPPVNAGPPNNGGQMVANSMNAQLAAQLEALTKQQQTLTEQIRQSEMNLTAQHGVLLQQQQVQIDEALNRAQEEMLIAQSQEYNLPLHEFDSKLQPIIDSCTKDSISNGKGWILQHCTDSGKCQIISQYLLRNIRKNADELKKCLESAVIPMFCNAQITANDEQRVKLTKLLSLWESKGNFFDACVISKLKSPPSSLQEYQTSLVTQHANVVAAITQATKNTFENYQQQHQAFVQHATQQITLLEKQKQQHLEQHARKTGAHVPLGGAPPPLLPELMAAVVGVTGGGPVNGGSGGGLVGPALPPSALPPGPPQGPSQVGDRGGGPPPGANGAGQIPSLLDQNINYGLLSAALQKLKNIQDNGPPGGGVGGSGSNIAPPQVPQGQGRDGEGSGDYTQPPPNFPIPDLSRPPPNFQYGSANHPPLGEGMGGNSNSGMLPDHRHSQHHHDTRSIDDCDERQQQHSSSGGMMLDDRDRDDFHRDEGLPEHQEDEHDQQQQQQQEQEQQEEEEEVVPPTPVKIPYFELPAGLMVPLIRLEDFSYHPLDPDEIRLPPPTPTNDRLVSAVEAFYAPPSHERPRDGEGWEKLALYEYFKVKNASRKQKEDEIDRGLRDRSRSPSPIDPDLLKATKKQKKRTYRSKSRSRSRSRSPGDNGMLLGGMQHQHQHQQQQQQPPPPLHGPGRNNQRHHRNHRSRSRSRTRSRSRSPARRSPSSGASLPGSVRPSRSRSPARRGGGGGGGGGSDRDHREPRGGGGGGRDMRRSPTPPSFGAGGYMKAASNFLEEGSKPGGSGIGPGGGGGGGGNHQFHSAMKGGMGGGPSGAMGGDRIGLGATIEPMRQEAYNPADPYESFRKNKGAAFITRMKARADERN